MAIVAADLLQAQVPAGSRDATPKARFAALDALRGLAALSVVICHYSIFLAATPIGQHLSPWLSISPFSLFKTAYGPVMLFFVLSGYVLALSLSGEDRPNWAGFAVRRLCRIWPPYAATILLSFAIGHFVLAASPDLPSVWQENTWHRDAISLGAVAGQISMASSEISLDVPAWSLVHELRISLAFPLLLIFVRRAPAMTIAASLGLHLAARVGPPWLSDLVPDTASYLVYFAAGAWLALNRTRIVEFAEPATALSRAVICGLSLLLLSGPGSYPAIGIVTGLGAVLLIAVATTSSAIAGILSVPWCQFLGRVSYSLYLTHIVVLMTLGATLGRSLPVWGILAVAAPVIGIVAWIGHRWVEQPSIRLGRTLARRFARPGFSLDPGLSPG